MADRLVIVAWGVLPPPVHGQSVMNGTTRALMEGDHAVTWINPTASTRIEELERLSVHKVLVGLAAIARFARATMASPAPDVAYVSPARSGAALVRDTLVWAIAVGARRRVIVHLHTGELEFLRAAAPLGMLQRVLLRSSEVWAQTAEWASELEILGAARSRVVPNGVSCDEDHGAWRGREATASPLHVVYLGNIALDKGIDLFVDAVAPMLDAGDVTVTVAGAAFESETDKLIDPLVARHGGAVRRIRHLDGAARCELLRSADVLVFPSRYDEAFSLVVCEAMEHGVVPVVSRRGALPSMVQSAGFCCDQAAEYADVLRRLDKDRGLLRERSAASASRWRERFSRGRYFERVAEALARAEPERQLPEDSPGTPDGAASTGETFWSENQPGTRFSRAPLGSEQFFREVEAHRYALEGHIREIVDFPHWSGADVLEAGCGIGTDGIGFARAGARYVAVDFSPAALDLVSSRFRLESLPGRFARSSVTHLPFEDGSFDMVFSHGVLHHVDDTQAAVHELHRVLRPGGTAVVMVYHRRSFNYYVTIMTLRRLLAAGLLIPGAAGVVGRLTGESQAVLEGHRRLLRRYRTRYLSDRALFLSNNTDGPGNPLSKAYSREEVARMFSGFRSAKTSVRNLNVRIYPGGRALARTGLARRAERRVGWHLYVEAVK